jgi:hypothetical protein
MHKDVTGIFCEMSLRKINFMLDISVTASLLNNLNYDFLVSI